MSKRSASFYFSLLPFCLVVFAYFSSWRDSPVTTQQLNTSPVVKIISPQNNDAFNLKDAINYQITVADKEDGDSKYDEIKASEVLLRVQYVNDRSKTGRLINKQPTPDPPGLAAIRASNCFNCHNFKNKAMGPSFFEISKRYPATRANLDTLTKRVSLGSTGIWGNEKMPSHPELALTETAAAVQWILKHSADPGIDYIVGLQGQFRPSEVMPPNKKAGAFILTASYTDPGLKDAPGKQRLTGEDAVEIFCK
jgi:cytochrome c